MSVVWRPTSVSVDVGRVSVPVFVMVAMVGLVRVLFVKVSVVWRPTSVSVDVGNVSVPEFVMVAIVGAVKVLFVNVSTVARPTSVSAAFGNVTVISVVCTPASVNVFAVVAPDVWNAIFFDASVPST